jgi:membrane protein DedA with SNARE-associated domain
VIESLFQILTDFFARYGYWVVFFGVMLENGGLPLPGETVLLFAGFLAYQGQIRLVWAIGIAIAGATLGDSLGYTLGRFGGNAFFDRYVKRFKFLARQFEKSSELFLKHGHWAVFTGRFITGLRVFAGPLAGLFKMPYPRFLFFNFTGAVLWATIIGCVGFLFGNSLDNLAHVVKDIRRVTFDLIAVLALVALISLIRRRAKGG